MANNDEIRWRQRFENLERAWRRLEHACDKTAYTELELAGLVQTFEFTFELAWNTLKDLLFYEGYEARSPRDSIVQAHSLGILRDREVWLAALKARNLFSHTYDEENAATAEKLIKELYGPMVGDLVDHLRQRIAEA